ncbi:cache domain-containing protein [Radicibacter daui]|uniref:cache domain-containing protein n=1 Tax=Radicibacter daui TaxID=3064829 RepID=UPI004046A49A
MHLRLQILALAIVPLVVAILAITAFITWQSTNLARASIETFEHHMLEAKQAELEKLTKLALSSIQDIYDAAGPDDEAAKEKVKQILGNIEYGEDGYFFVYDYNGLGVVHPRQPFRPGKNWIDLVDPDGKHVIAQLIERAREGGGIFRYKWEKPSTGEVADKLSYAVGLDKWHWMLGTGVYLDDVFAKTRAADADLRATITRTFFTVTIIAIPSVLLVFFTCMFINVRQQRLADTKLKELTQRVIDTQEEERLRIARELHDGISQNLVGVRYALDLARRRVTAESPEALAAIEKGAGALNDAIKEVRRISHDLRPGVIDDLGLTTALKALVENFSERNNIPATLDSVAFKHMLVPEARIALYRVAQEALTNIERHAGATAVTVRFSSQRGRIQMQISDNGRGFAATDKRRAGLGLRNMQERMAHFGGQLLVESSAKGTTLTAQLPVGTLMARPAAGEAA